VQPVSRTMVGGCDGWESEGVGEEGDRWDGGTGEGSGHGDVAVEKLLLLGMRCAGVVAAVDASVVVRIGPLT
jgi:hypothetical protein